MQEIKTDVLVIGGGIAGLWAALTARQKVNSVCVVDKGFVGKTSHSALSAGSITVLRPEDDFQACLDDLIEAQDGIIDRDLAAYLLINSYNRIKDMEELGMEYRKEGNNYVADLCRGARYVHLFPSPMGGGEAPLRVLIRELTRREVKIINRIFISNLLSDGEKVIGAFGIETRSGDPYLFKAKAVVIASNTTGFRGHYFACDLVGDGPMIAYRSGAEIEGAEFITFNTASTVYHMEGTSTPAMHGAKFRNAEGEAFMARYYPERKDRVDTGYITKAMAMEAREGKAPPLYYDFTGMTERHRPPDIPKEPWLPMPARRQTYNSLGRVRVREWGIETGKPEWMPALMYHVGAISTNLEGMSSLPGLFAAGKARGGIGIGLMTGWSWCSCLGSGYLAGESAGEYARQTSASRIDKTQVANYHEDLFEPLNRDSLTTSDEVLKEIQEVVFPYYIMILKHEDRLKEALINIYQIRDEKAWRMVAKDIHGLIKVKETENILLNAEMFLSASIKRTESREGHYRDDFPKSDNTNWLKHVVIFRGPDGDMELKTRSLRDKE